MLRSKKSNEKKRSATLSYAIGVVGIFLIPIVWALLKYQVGVSDRYLPSFELVFDAIDDFKPSIWVHTLITLSRLIIGLILGILFGIALAVIVFKWRTLNKLLMPTIQALRSVPPIATVPFFILWFGFSEYGRYIMILVGIAFNLAIAAYQILNSNPSKYEVMFKSFNLRPQDLLFSYIIPRISEEILPTIRFSLSTAIGLVIVSELLGAQTGLGYLIQTSRSTYSLHVIFLAMIILGLINAGIDRLLIVLWHKLVFWK